MNRRSAAPLVVACALAVAVLIRSRDGGAVDSRTRDLRESEADERAERSSDLPHASREAASTREPASAVGSRHVRVPAGLHARARWIHGEDPLRLHRTRHGVPDSDLPAWVELGDGAVLDLPRGEWIWLCAELSGSCGRFTVYGRMAPDSVDEPIDLGPGTGASVWILAYGRTLDGPARPSVIHCVDADGTRATRPFDPLGFATLDAARLVFRRTIGSRRMS